MNDKEKITVAVFCVAIMLTVSIGVIINSVQNPVAVANASPSIANVNAAIEFSATGSSTGADSYEWLFRDNTDPVSGFTFTHSFTMEGIYEVGLLVKIGGKTALGLVKVTIRNYYPEARAVHDSIACEDEVKTFDASTSTDQNGENDIAGYYWEFGDGSTSGLKTASHSFAKDGVYVVTLTVTDAEGAKGTKKTQITIQNKAPSANAGADRIVNEDDVVNFNAGGSIDTTSDINSLTYYWDFGDGTTGNGILASHKYAEKGIYTTTLRVTDDDGESDVDDAVVTVTNVVPSANAGPDQTVRESQTVLFDGAGTTDTPTDKTILDYSWNFGGQGINPTYVWSDDGVKSVSLTATDNDAASNTDGMDVNVQNVAPSVGINALAVSDTTSVNFTLRSAGEKWRDVHLYLHEDNVLIRELAVYRNPGSPDNQSDTAYGVILEFGKTYNVSVFFTPADDPVNGQPQGDSPSWIILGLEDGRQFWIQHNFNVNQPDTYRWDVDFSSIVKVTPRAAALDPGSDDVTLNWNFGDAQSPIVSHYYANYGKYPMYVNDSAIHVYVWPGSYAVILTAVDDDGGSNSHTVQLSNQPSSVTIDNYAPIATAGNNQVANEDSTVSFGGSAADDPADVLSYLWDFGDDSFATGVNAIHVYRYAGTYLVILTVTDNHGAVDQDALFVIIDNIAPISEAGGDQAINEDGTAVFSGSQSIDTASDKPLLTYLWDFGDGTFGNGIGTSHVYTKVGTYTVTLMVTDNDGASDTDSLTVSVSNVAPTANAGSAQSANEDQIVFFSGTAIDTPTDWQILSYSWTFGDGGIGHGKNPTHSYVNAGTYSVTLVVVDNNGATASSSLQVTVSNVIPVMSMSGYPATSKRVWAEAVYYQFDASAIDSFSDQNLLTYDWDLGDGNAASARNPSHMYTASGTYLVTLIVADNEGASVSSSLLINVIIDSDGDILRDEDEIGVYHTDPFKFDTDGDWLTDYTEVTDVVDNQGRHTDPTKADSDSDGLNDWEERYDGEDYFITDPFNPDTDGDGLIDSQEIFTKAFKTNDRFNLIDGTSNSAGITIIQLSNVVAQVPDSNLIYKADAKIGLSHENISNLQILISKDGTNFIQLKSWDSKDVGGSSYFTNFDLLVPPLSSSFTKADFRYAKTWSLKVIDYRSGQIGSLEYFEIHITARTNPVAWSSDGDGLNDFEETNLGNDGWYTEPWMTSTDGDSWSDSYEVVTKGTDPTRADTDRDGANDDDDLDPLHNLLIRIKVSSFWAFENDPEVPGDVYPEPFVGIEYGDTWIFTPREFGFTGYGGYFNYDSNTGSYGYYYTLDVSDDKDSPSVVVKMHAYEDDWLADKEWNINYGQNKYETVTYLILGNTHSFYTSSGSPSNSYDDTEKWNASLSFQIDTVTGNRINTILLTSTDGESVYSTPSGTWASNNQMRYFGEDEFYVAILKSKSNYYPFVSDYNAIIIPRSVFLDSKLNYTLETTADPNNLPSYLKQLEFGTYDASSSTTTGSVISTFTGEVWGSEAYTILNSFLMKNKDGAVIAQSHVVTSQLLTLNIDDDVIKLIPFTGIRFDATGTAPSDLLGRIGSFIVGIGNLIWNALVAIGNFFLDLGKAILSWGLKILGAIIDFFSAVVNAVVKALEVLLDFISWILTFTINLIESAIDSFLASLNSMIYNFILALGNAFEAAANYYSDTGTLNQDTIASINSAFMSTFFWVCMGMATAIVIIMTVLGYIPLVGLIFGILTPVIMTCILLALGGQSSYDQTSVSIPDSSSDSPAGISSFMLSYMNTNAPSPYYGPTEIGVLSLIFSSISFGLIEIYVLTLSSFVAELVLILTLTMIICTLMIAIKLYSGEITNLSYRAIAMLSLFGAVLSGLSIVSAFVSLAAAIARLSATQIGLAVASQIAGFISITLYILSIP